MDKLLQNRKDLDMRIKALDSIIDDFSDCIYTINTDIDQAEDSTTAESKKQVEFLDLKIALMHQIIDEVIDMNDDATILQAENDTKIRQTAQL